ncbi:hypothetical protein OPT61_g1040 [Boeremia exigua]|uniref:Uncharacterized protein n=1 Tax=Boeremia exigua TaxID=749465 RepID=A0ACC2IS20_9PLEO|nr:hypothetical protein OPT61_g1040 [Boeremia exigua]
MSTNFPTVITILAAFISLPPSILAVWSIVICLRGCQTDIEANHALAASDSQDAGARQASGETRGAPSVYTEDSEPVVLRAFASTEDVALPMPPKPCFIQQRSASEGLESDVKCG